MHEQEPHGERYRACDKHSICPEKLTSKFDVKRMWNKVNERMVGTEKSKNKNQGLYSHTN